ncbi:MAG: YbaK/EbsC family protein [Treponemataceae bacterium]|nr:YbaK/EbsC family protein [Treponemataceae bacterium]
MSLEKVRARFAGTEMEGKIMELAQSSATVELAAAALSCEPDRIAKSLSFLIGDACIVVVVSGLSKIDNAKYKARFGAKAKMVPADDVERLTGHAVGGVCPFALNDGCTVYLDESLRAYDFVYPAAGSTNSAVKMTIAQLETFSGYAAWVDVTKKAEDTRRVWQ